MKEDGRPRNRKDAKYLQHSHLTNIALDFTVKVSSNGDLGRTIKTRQKGIPVFVESGVMDTQNDKVIDVITSMTLSFCVSVCHTLAGRRHPVS